MGPPTVGPELHQSFGLEGIVSDMPGTTLGFFLQPVAQQSSVISNRIS
jgi:hypothetical protein